MSVPFYYDHINAATSQVNPSTMHASNTALSWYFSRYLTQKAISVFNWDIPEEWGRDYMLYGLYLFGHIAMVRTPEYGIIPQVCTLSGYDVFYRPTRALIGNPLIREKEFTLHKDAELLKLTPDYGGIFDKIQYYASMMSLIAEDAGVNLVNSKLSYVFAAGNKTSAESLKKMFDGIASGEPAVFADKKLYHDDGTPAWETFQQNVRNNYITGDLLQDLRTVENDFCTDVGIPNANLTKRERMITDEVNANNIETSATAELWLDTMHRCIRDIERTFPELTGRIRVDWRHPPEVPMQEVVMDE